MTDQVDQIETEEEAFDELTMLKKRADLMGLSYSSRIGVEALKLKIDNKLNGVTEEANEAALTEPSKSAPVSLTKAEQDSAIRVKQNAEMMKLVRLRITNLNPNKKELQGEILTVANKFLGIVKKFIPYGEVTDGGYQVPFILYQELKARKFLSIKTKRDAKGNVEVIQRWVPEFALEVLPQITEEELGKLAAAQAAAGVVE